MIQEESSKKLENYKIIADDIEADRKNTEAEA